MRIGSLFSGYGGLDMAVATVLGAEVAWHVEYDRAPSRILAHHYPEIPNYGDVTRVDWTRIGPIDVLTGGYPCQPFSKAGQRKGTDDERHLWPYVLDALRTLRPILVVLENVRDHLSLGFDAVLGDLADSGWAAEWCVIRASDAGACHERPRLFIVAYSDSFLQRFRGVCRQVDRGYGFTSSEGTTGPQSVSRSSTANDADKGRSNAFGPYSDAVNIWASLLGRPAPSPLDADGRLRPEFPEWMMGLPEGWVTDPDIGISRAEQLKALGNGVVPQQAELALSILLPRVRQYATAEEVVA